MPERRKGGGKKGGNMNSLGSEGEGPGMNLGGGEEDEDKEGNSKSETGEHECEEDWYTEEDDSWWPNMFIITKGKEEKEEESSGEWMARNKKGRAKPIMNVRKNEEWECVDAVVDSGAVETVCGVKTVPENKRRSTKASIGGQKYYSADGGKIQNLGEGLITGMSDEGHQVQLKARVGDKLSNLLVSVSNACEAGNMVIFGADHEAIRKLAKMEKVPENAVINKKTMTTSQMRKDNGLYKYRIWRKKESESRLSTIIEGEEKEKEKTPFQGQARR